MPTSFSHIGLCLVTFPLILLQSLQNQYYYFCHRYRYFHITLLLNTLLQILSLSGAVELTTQLLILVNILWLPLCQINKFGLNTLPSKTVAIPYTCGLSHIFWDWQMFQQGQPTGRNPFVTWPRYHPYASTFQLIWVSKHFWIILMNVAPAFLRPNGMVT